MVETLGRTGDRILKRIFSKGNAIQSIEGDSEEIKTALQVRIQGTVKDGDVDYYIVHIWLVFDSKRTKQLKKRYSNFLELKESLERQGYDNLPNLPSKKISLLFNDADKRERRYGLEQFIKALVNRKDTRNSIIIQKFLELENFCPEINFNIPQLLVKKSLKEKKQYVNNCLFVPEHNLYVISLVTTKGTSEVQIFSFRQTGLIQDHFVLKTNETSERHTESVKSDAESDEISPQITGRPSVAEMLESPGGTNVLMSRKNTLFSSIPDSKDPLN